MKSFVRVMKALSEPNRVRMVKLLARRELCVCELQHLFGLAQSTVSKHLKILEEAGLIDYRKEGLWIIYRLSAGGKNPNTPRRYWNTSMDGLNTIPSCKKWRPGCPNWSGAGSVTSETTR